MACLKSSFFFFFLSSFRIACFVFSTYVRVRVFFALFYAFALTGVDHILVLLLIEFHKERPSPYALLGWTQSCRGQRGKYKHVEVEAQSAQESWEESQSPSLIRLERRSITAMHVLHRDR